MAKLTSLGLAFVAGLGVVPGCTDREPLPTPAATVAFTDGARLKAVHYRIEGAPPVFLSWYDSQLGVDCSFMYPGFGDFLEHPVCVPSDDAGPKFARDAFLFADSNCGERIVGSYFPGESRYFVEWSDADAGCGPRPSVFHVAEVVPLTAPLYTMDSSTGACGPRPATDLNHYSELRRLGAEIPIETLVSGTLRHDAGPARIVPLEIVGSDGSMQSAATETTVVAWDNERQEMVRVADSLPPRAPSDTRWFPAFASNATYFSDAGCTMRAAVGFACGVVAKAATISTIDHCGRPLLTSVFELGPRLSGRASVYATNPDNNACLQTDDWPVTDPLYATHAVGAGILPSSFAEAIEVRTGTAQLRVIQAGSPDGAAIGSTGLFDTVHGQLCSFSVPAADGTVRCLPATMDAAGHFADDACSIPVVPVTTPAGACASRPTFASRDEGAGSGRPRRHVYPVGGPYLGMVYGRTSSFEGEDCVLIGDESDVIAEQVFATGPEIPAAAFAPMNLVRPN
jgi:hypothetical protein